jgi:hypothetical protein
MKLSKLFGVLVLILNARIMKYQKIFHPSRRFNNPKFALYGKDNLQSIYRAPSPKLRLFGIGIVIVEFILIAGWFYVSQPETTLVYDLPLISFFLLGINLILGLLLYFFKKQLSLIFLANSIICPLAFFAIWIMWFLYFI